MVTMAQRIEALRTERNLSRPALSAALGFPKSAAEKFETGRQTPSQDQQKKLAEFFGVTLAYLRGEVDVREEGQGTWLGRAYAEEAPAPAPAPKRPAAPVVVQSSGGGQDSAVFSALLNSKSFQGVVRAAVLDVLRSPEGQALLRQAVRKELGKS